MSGAGMNMLDEPGALNVTNTKDGYYLWNSDGGTTFKSAQEVQDFLERIYPVWPVRWNTQSIPRRFQQP